MLRTAGERHAGAYAKTRFKRSARAWRRRVLRASQVTILGCISAAMIAAYTVSDDTLQIAFGALAGGLAAALMMLRDLVPPHVEMWRRGWESERRTARALRKQARHGWSIVHDIELSDESSGAWNIDHVLVGPSGVFLLDTKWYTGVTTFVDGQLMISFPDDPTEKPRYRRLGPRMRGAAADLKDRIREACGEKVWVNAVVVLWSPFEQGVVKHEDVTYVHGSKLSDWLETQPRSAKPFADAEVTAALRGMGAGERMRSL